MIPTRQSLARPSDGNKENSTTISDLLPLLLILPSCLLLVIGAVVCGVIKSRYQHKRCNVRPAPTQPVVPSHSGMTVEKGRVLL